MKNQSTKHILIASFFLFKGIVCLGQSNAGQQNFERKTVIEINERADFYHVNDRYGIISDTIFYCRAGFFVEPDYGVKKIGDKEYLIFKYPKYNNKNYQASTDKNIRIYKVDEVDTNAIYVPIYGKSGRTLMIEKNKFDNLSKTILYSTKWSKRRNYKVTTGLLTIPFKFRPKTDTANFNLTTDVTLGPYIGLTKRLSRRNPFYATVPATLGLSFININNNTTSNEIANDEVGVIPGISWSSGVIFQFNKFNLGFVFGRDYASGIGDDWIYQGKTWYSFAIGYSFLNQESE